LLGPFQVKKIPLELALAPREALHARRVLQSQSGRCGGIVGADGSVIDKRLVRLSKAAEHSALATHDQGTTEPHGPSRCAACVTAWVSLQPLFIYGVVLGKTHLMPLATSWWLRQPGCKGALYPRRTVCQDVVKAYQRKTFSSSGALPRWTVADR
jgi:hypothetical protein